MVPQRSVIDLPPERPDDGSGIRVVGPLLAAVPLSSRKPWDMDAADGFRCPPRPCYGRDVAKECGSGSFKGQLMLQIAAGRFFRPGVPINEHTHRLTVYSNTWFAEPGPQQLPVGSILGSTELGQVSTAMLEAVDRLEARRPDGTDDFMIATGGDDLIDDIAYVLTFVLNRTFSRNHDQVVRLVAGKGGTRTRRDAAALFPGLFDPQQILQAGDLEAVRLFMDDLLALAREDFARVMRVIRNTVDASRRAIDDPTGAYTDLVAALESLGDDHLTGRSTWDRYDGRKRKIIDAALNGANKQLVEDVRAAVLEADRLGLKRRFVSSTLARVSDAYFRSEAVGAVRPPRSADLERMLSIAYDIRSRRSHVLEDLGDEAWVFTDGAETVVEPRFRHILTLAGLWRLIRHVARRFVAETPKRQPEPWDYRATLPGIIQAELAPQYWVWQANGVDANTAEMWLNGVAEAFISWYSGHTDDGINLSAVVDKIENIVPAMTDGPAKTAMVAVYALWNDWTDPGDRRCSAAAFLEAHGACLDTPSVTAFAVGLLSDRASPEWTADEWAELAAARRAVRATGKEAPLPAAIDALLQLETADQLEAAGRHDEAVLFASNAVEERPGHKDLLAWEEHLLAGHHDPAFDCHKFLFGRGAGAQRPTQRPDAQGEGNFGGSKSQQRSNSDT